MKALALIAALLAKTVAGLTAAEWRSQSIYFLLTDRFGRTDNSTTATCNVSERVRTFMPTLLGIPLILLNDCIRFTVVVAGKESSITYVGLPFSIFQALLRLFQVGLYPRHGIHCHLDYPRHRTALSGYRRWRSIPRILATGDVRGSFDFKLRLN